MKRVLLVEDDAAIRRYVAMALEDLPVELVHAESLLQARQALAAGRFGLIITDLMLPDGHGADWLASLQAQPALRGGAGLAVFSAGLNVATRKRLDDLGVTHVLEKPTSVKALLACVEQYVGGASGAPLPAPQMEFESGLPTPPSGQAAAEEEAIATHFAGQRELFTAFKATSLDQFVLDIRDGDLAVSQGDAAALRRVAHNLKSVLRLIGHGQASEAAHRLELSAERADVSPAGDAAQWEQLQAQWQALCGQIPR